MAVVITNLRADGKETGNARPDRAMDAQKIIMTAALDTGWINKEFLAVVSFSHKAKHAGITVQVWGRYKLNGVGDADTEHRVGDKDGVQLLLDLDQSGNDANGASFIIDQAGLVDEIKFIFSGNVTGDFVLGLGA